MYAEFYHLTGLPFQLTPDPRFFFGSAGHNNAMAHLIYGLNQGEGFIVITGDVGTGKTTIVDLLLGSIDRDRHVAAKIVMTQLEGDDMLRMVASAFGLYEPKMEKAALLRAIEDFLIANAKAGKRVLLVIDEAQNLSFSALEELRMLSNLTVDASPSLQSFLVGQPQFRKMIASAELEQLRQRVTASYRLGPISEIETKAYVSHRMETVGWKGDPAITDDAFSAIYRYSAGVPRRINTLCSRLLLFGYLEEKHTLDGRDVELVAREMLDEFAERHDSPINLHALTQRTATPGAAPAGTIADLSGRLDHLETSVNKHERAIKLALETILSVVDGTR